jgi:biotin carboxyl carrier protein
MIHDTESYIITIRRKNSHAPSLSAGPVTISGNTIPDLTATDTVREDTASQVSSGYKVVSPLPGIIISVRVKTGDKVRAGQELVVLEAMKMENSIEATHEGTVTAIHVKEGDSVLEGTAVITIE